MSFNAIESFSAIEVPDIGFEDAQFRALIAGASALLMNNPAGMQVVSDETKRTTERKIPLPADEAEAKAYRLATGELYVRPEAIRRAMVLGAKEFADPRNKRATLTKPVAAAIGAPASDAFVLANADGEVLTDYEVSTMRAVVQRQGVMRSRAKINLPWFCRIQFTFDASLVSGEQLALVLAMAGSKVGILDFRPEKGGPYGRFRIDQFEVSE